MKKIFTTALVLCFATIIALGQTLLTSQFLGSRTKQQMTNQYFIFPVKNGVKYYKVTYETPDVQGNTSIASGLLVVPDDTAKVYPLLCYQHGTSSTKLDVPSSVNQESELPIIFASLGYITFAPDYLGLGVSPGFHPYVHANTEASAGLDGLRAARDFSDENNLHFNQQVFLTGYSQGGHASMALHKSLQDDHADEFNVTAAAHLSGPYSISGVMRDLLLSDVAYGRPAYLINTLFSYQYVYGNVYNDLADVIKPEYVSMSQQYYNGTISLTDLNDFMVATLTANEGAPIASRAFNPDFVAAIENDPNHPANIAMADNDRFDWMATAPTRLYYCSNDDQVPFQNSVIAETAMNAAGSTNLDAVDVSPNSDHVGCVTPAVFNTVYFFQVLQSVTDVPVSSVWERDLPFSVYPNPAKEVFFVKNFPSNGELMMTDLQGRVVLRQDVSSGDNEIMTDGLQNGLYFVNFQSSAGIFQMKIMVSH